MKTCDVWALVIEACRCCGDLLVSVVSNTHSVNCVHATKLRSPGRIVFTWALPAQYRLCSTISPRERQQLFSNLYRQIIFVKFKAKPERRLAAHSGILCPPSFTHSRHGEAKGQLHDSRCVSGHITVAVASFHELRSLSPCWRRTDSTSFRKTGYHNLETSQAPGVLGCGGFTRAAGYLRM